MGEGLCLYVIDPNAIFRRGVVECLRALHEVVSVGDASSVGRARTDPGLRAAGVVLADPALEGAEELIAAVTGAGTAVLACVTATEAAAGALKAGAIGCLLKASLTPETLAIGVQAAAAGLVVSAPELLGAIGAGRMRSPEVSAPAVPSATWLTNREQRVLQLLADGLPTREVAQRLSYSERTVKSVLRDAVLKLGARSRSEAIAHAVREGII